MKYVRSILFICIYMALCANPVHAGFFKDVGNAVSKPVKKVTKPIKKVIKKTVKVVENTAKDIKEETIEIVSGEEREDMINDVRKNYGDARRQLQTAKSAVVSQFQIAIEELDDAIEQMEYYGIDPKFVRLSDGNYTNLYAQRNSIISQKKHAIHEIDSKIAKINQDEVNAIREINSKYR